MTPCRHFLSLGDLMSDKLTRPAYEVKGICLRTNQINEDEHKAWFLLADKETCEDCPYYEPIYAEKTELMLIFKILRDMASRSSAVRCDGESVFIDVFGDPNMLVELQLDGKLYLVIKDAERVELRDGLLYRQAVEALRNLALKGGRK